MIATVLWCVLAGIALGCTTEAQDQDRLTEVQDQDRLRWVDIGKGIWRFYDQEYGIVCYRSPVSTELPLMISCVKVP